MPAYTTEGSLSHGLGGLFENFAYDATTPSLEEKAQPFGFPAMPIDIPSAALVDPSFTPPTNALTHNLSGFSPHAFSSSYSSSSSSSYTSSSSSLGSISGDPTPWPWWSRMHSSVPSAVSQGSYHLNFLDQEPGNFPISGTPPDGLGTFGGSLAASPGPDARAPTTEATDVKLEQYSAIHSGSLIHHPVLKRQNYERTTDQIAVQETFDRRFICTIDNCGKSFSGEWEKTRHIKSIHRPPTIGCRDCAYKQSRKDLFSEHCKKRHPGISIEELLVHLVHANGMGQ